MESFRNGTWTRPTEADPALFPGLGGCKAIVHQTRQQSASSPASSEGTNVLASLEGVQPTLDEYLRSFQSQTGTSQTNGPMGITSSDDFLRGALTGDWAGLASSRSEPAVPDQTSQYNTAPTPFNMSWQDPVSLYNTQPVQQNGPHFFPSPYSDGGVSSGSSGNGAKPTFDYTPPFQPLVISPTPNNNVGTGQDPETVVIWDNFLRDLGLQNIPR